MSNGKESLSPSEMDPNDLPDVPAFQDEYTRDYLNSTDPVREGFYPFESGTKSFTLDFPEDMVVDESSNIAPENRFESLIIHHSGSELEVMDEYNIYYLSAMSDVQSSKDTMNKRAGKELDFTELNSNHEKQYIEIAEVAQKDSTDRVAALIWNDNGQQIQVFTSVICREDIDTEKCNQIKEKEKEEVIGVLKSIKLITDKGK